jgi:hypothetical protein
MNRWKLKVHDNVGHARIVLTDGPNAIGIMNMTWFDYGQLCKQMTQFVFDQSKESIAQVLEKRIWNDAIRIFDNSPELAKMKLAEWGWTREMIASYATELSMHLMEKLIEHLPEHTA